MEMMLRYIVVVIKKRVNNFIKFCSTESPNDCRYTPEQKDAVERSFEYQCVRVL